MSLGSGACQGLQDTSKKICEQNVKQIYGGKQSQRGGERNVERGTSPAIYLVWEASDVFRTCLLKRLISLRPCLVSPRTVSSTSILSAFSSSSASSFSITFERPLTTENKNVLVRVLCLNSLIHVVHLNALKTFYFKVLFLL